MLKYGFTAVLEITLRSEELHVIEALSDIFNEWVDFGSVLSKVHVEDRIDSFIIRFDSTEGFRILQIVGIQFEVREKFFTRIHNK